MATKEGPYFQGGRYRSVEGMAATTAAFRDVGGLPAEASLILSQLVLNMAGFAGRGVAVQLIVDFLSAADAPLQGQPR
jgi:hypothetical protein